MYRVERKDGVVELLNERRAGIEEARNILNEILSEMKQFKILPTPENVEKLFSIEKEELLKKLREAFEGVKEKQNVMPLFNAYSKIIRMLYGKETTSEFIEDLFVRHTLMHMIVLSSLAHALKKTESPEDNCSGASLDVEVGLLYLNWWRFPKEINKEILDEVLKEVDARTSLIDWEYSGVEDVFRQLYEFLVEPNTRRKIGEYYTPLWLVELILNEFNLKDKLILDPFCGSGTFLVKAFHKKVEEGEEPENAFDEVIGFDINPLAVAVARAELIIAYLRYKQSKETRPPHVYHTDSIGRLMAFVDANKPGFKQYIRSLETEGVGLEEIDELQNAFNGLASTLSSPLFKNDVENNMKPVEVVRSLSEIERSISNSISLAMDEGGSISESIERYLEEELRNKNPLANEFYEYMKKNKISGLLEKWIRKYGGNNVWSLVLSSCYVPIVLRFAKPHIIVTNPPWILTTEFNAGYSNVINERARELLRSIDISSRASASIVAGGDIASIALHEALKIAKEGVAFIMNREQSFYAKSSILAGVILTYAVLRDALGDRKLKLIDLNYDAFNHGIIPAVVIAKKEKGEPELYEAEVRAKDGRISKSDSLEKVEVNLRNLGISYDEYIEQGLTYFREDSESIARLLDAVNVMPMGLYIRGLYGGEKKKGEESYAGIVLEELEQKGQMIRFKLSNTSRALEVHKRLFDKFGVRVYSLVYVKQINPFWIEDLPK
ncbi:MAG: N-6 DNA methylase, partial [Thermoproteota archaeon]